MLRLALGIASASDIAVTAAGVGSAVDVVLERAEL
jgi:hypothetical protein